jgi:hypothetical protein
MASIAHGQLQPEHAAQIPLLRQLYVQDQRDRGVLLSDSGEAIKPDAGVKPPERPEGNAISARDAERRQQVRDLLADGLVVTAQDFHDAAFIFQHGDNSDDYLLAHILAIEAVVKGDASSKWIAAATLDRYLQSIGQKQVFGTQYLDDRFRYYLQHRNDADLAEKMNTISTQITQQPYNDQLMPDALRSDFCVPGLKRQTEAVQGANNSKNHSIVIPTNPGCGR